MMNRSPCGQGPSTLDEWTSWFSIHVFPFSATAFTPRVSGATPGGAPASTLTMSGENSVSKIWWFWWDLHSSKYFLATSKVVMERSLYGKRATVNGARTRREASSPGATAWLHDAL